MNSTKPSYRDYIWGAESDSGIRLHITTCPNCGKLHVLALTRLEGRFMFSCGPRHMAGMVANWKTHRETAQMTGADLIDSEVLRG